MADTADSPPAGGSEFAPAPSAGSLPRRDPVRGLAPPTSAESPEVYRPLSLLAIVVFGLAIFYSWVIAGIAVFTYFSGDTLFLPFWTLLPPAVILPLCLAARRRVLRSEGTLGGERLVNWGLGLTIVFGLGYWSYHAATFLALRQQAVAFVGSKFIPALTKGNIEEAYILTYVEPRPAVNNELRGVIESKLNTPAGLKIPGRFTLFAESEYIRLFQMANGKAEVTLTSIGTPVLEKGNLNVPLIYHVVTPLKYFDMQVLAMASNSQSKESRGRQWQIELQSTGTVPQSASMNDPEGLLVLGRIEPLARAFLTSWVIKVTAVFDADAAYRYTLPLKERRAIAQAIHGKSEAELNKAAETKPELRRYLDGLNEFRAGGLVRKEKEFWVTESHRTDVIKEVKKRFLSGNATANWMTLSSGMPIYENDGKKIRFSYDVHLQLLPLYVGVARLIVEADTSSLKDPTGPQDVEVWRLVAMDMVRGNAAPKADARQKSSE
jgi:hypothetical protein